ncbi:MAG: vitamin K epoxide reductase family protein [Bdellovibrionales bacterium]
MKTRTQLALASTFFAVLGHLYLTLHYYPLKFGFAAGQSLCNINAKFDCDAVAASAYSALLGIPLSVWGLVTNAVLFVMVLLSWLEWTENPERLRRWTLALAGVSAGASVVMALISFALMQNYCLFCIGLYALSFLTFAALLGVPREPFWMHFRRDPPMLLKESRGILFFLAVIPVGSYLVHQMFMQNLGDAQVARMIQESVADWQNSPKNEFVAKPTLATGAGTENAALTITEFADFRCGHCKHASYTLEAFVKSHPDVRFEFYSFPLDGACNEGIQSANGISCRLAAAVFCAEKEGKGWEAHHVIFEKQEEINRMSSVSEIDTVLANSVSSLGLNWEALQSCMQEGATTDALRAQAKQGLLVNVRGTPTIFANGRLLTRGQVLPVLQNVRQKALESKGK